MGNDDDEDFILDCSETIGMRLDELENLKRFAIKKCSPVILNIIFNHWTQPLPGSLDIDPGRLPPDGHSMAFSVSLLRMLVSTPRLLFNANAHPPMICGPLR